MLINLKNNLHWLIYIISLVAGICCFVDGLLIWGVMCLLGGVYGWLISSLIIEQYDFKYFLYVVCGSGILISIVFFFINGVEQVPFPEGAVLFKGDGIAQALFLFFIFTVPVILYHHGSGILTNMSSKSYQPKKTIQNNVESNDEDWETATIEDLESGNYETI